MSSADNAPASNVKLLMCRLTSSVRVVAKLVLLMLILYIYLQDPKGMHQVVASQFAAEDHENCHDYQKDIEKS